MGRATRLDWQYRGQYIRTRSVRRVGDTDIEPAWADEAFADDGADLAVRSSRLGLAWANAVRMEGDPQVRRRAPSFVLAA